MIRVKFNNKRNYIDVNFKMISEKEVILTGTNIPKNESGFKTYRMNGDLLGDFSEFKICKETKNGFIFETAGKGV